MPERPDLLAAMSALDFALDEMLNPPPYVPDAEEAEHLSVALPHLLTAFYAHEREPGETATWNYHGKSTVAGAWEITLRQTDATDPDALTGCADDQLWADVPVDALRDAIADRNGNRRDRGTGLGPKDESSGAKQSPNLSSGDTND